MNIQSRPRRSVAPAFNRHTSKHVPLDGDDDDDDDDNDDDDDTDDPDDQDDQDASHWAFRRDDATDGWADEDDGGADFGTSPSDRFIPFQLWMTCLGPEICTASTSLMEKERYHGQAIENAR